MCKMCVWICFAFGWLSVVDLFVVVYMVWSLCCVLYWDIEDVHSVFFRIWIACVELSAASMMTAFSLILLGMQN